ncbi:hypothetical protein I7I53_07675 [Histoplasma capsulatum var. duboisii H88]|uniref:Uncharacterized protein n=1 Tax=Ajellomyces capsulatus (strain H88) TaxID=544711 RepID=A0A8A1LCL3_AJEC8|nr:hypothetical protein I7I53_07675 [Histoplasma capsulatum var. duboisii H88]
MHPNPALSEGEGMTERHISSRETHKRMLSRLWASLRYYIWGGHTSASSLPKGRSVINLPTQAVGCDYTQDPGCQMGLYCFLALLHF